MAGPGLSTTRVAGATGHVADTNAVHGIVNKFDTAAAATSGHVLVGNGTVFNNRALLSTDIPGVVTNTITNQYTVVLADAGKLVELNVGSAHTFTIPPNSSVAFPIGTVINVRQYGAGTTTVNPGAGVTIRSRGGAMALAGQYAEATVTKRATDEWVLSGDVV
jgi:hypothetical protein